MRYTPKPRRSPATRIRSRVGDQAHRNALRDRIVGEMTAALVGVGDRYRAPDGVLYSLIEESALDPPSGEGRLGAMRPRPSRSSKRSFDSKTYRSDQMELAVHSFAGATARKIPR